MVLTRRKGKKPKHQGILAMSVYTVGKMFLYSIILKLLHFPKQTNIKSRLIMAERKNSQILIS